MSGLRDRAATPGGRFVKAFTHVYAADDTAKATATSYRDALGFDAVDLGPLAEGWRVRRDTPGDGPDIDADQLRQAAAQGRRYRDTG